MCLGFITLSVVFSTFVLHVKHPRFKTSDGEKAQIHRRLTSGIKSVFNKGVSEGSSNNLKVKKL